MGAYTRSKGEIAGSIAQVYEQFPRLKERYKQIGVHPVRRRAADAGHGPGSDEQAQAADAG